MERVIDPVPVTTVDRVTDHPNAERLSLVSVGEWTMVWGKTNEGEHAFKAGDLVVHIPVGSKMPDWLLQRMGYWNAEKGRGTLGGKEHNEVRLARFRQITSGGLLYPVTKVSDADAVVEGPEGETRHTQIGDNMADFLGITPPSHWARIIPPRPDMELTFRGWIMEGRDKDCSNALYLIDHTRGCFGDPLAKEVYQRTDYGKRQISVSYHVSDEPLAEVKLHELTIAMMCGITHEGMGVLSYGHQYSATSGYLYTDENFKVGGHDIIAELRSSIGKWCFLRVLIHGDKQKQVFVYPKRTP